jgi:hypothetical protein
MSDAAEPPQRAWWGCIQDAAEMWIYALNERQHWLFRLYDGVNEAWARLVFRGVRRRAARFARELPAAEANTRLRFLAPADLDAFVALLAAFEFQYVPPHPLDRSAAARALRRASYLPFGIFRADELIGYVLVRIVFPRRAVSDNEPSLVAAKAAGWHILRSNRRFHVLRR